jgi:hypothetical protein
MTQYPYFQAQIITDSVFLQYGGQTGTSTQAQRNAAYLLAEEQMTEHLSAFLVPTIITGSAMWKGKSLFEAEFGYIQRLLLSSVTTIKQLSPLETQIYTGSALIRNSDYGYVDIVVSNNAYGNIYSATLVYESGLATGTVTSPTFLAALTMASQINLNEWDVSLSNEGTADVGIQAYSNQSYSEQRKYLGRTVFGDSPMAQRVARMTRKYRAKPTTGFR